jgi:23S rRNA (uridine2552-2'-O)-methyltransferase
MKKIRDHYFKKAKEEKYLARSVYKLIEIDRKYRLLKRGCRVLDIGCAPGSWSQYILQRIGNGYVVGVDLAERVKVQDRRFSYVVADILDSDTEKVLNQGAGFDIITSDAAPKTTGNGFTDAQASLRIVERVFGIAGQSLKMGGTVIAKVLQGEDLKNLVDGLRYNYSAVSLFKPRSSRSESRELFIIAQGRRELP